MTKDDLIENGFINAFISEYLEYYIYSYYPDKDRLLYVLCDNDNERDIITKAEITTLKSKIKQLGYEDLSFGFIQSSKKDSNCFIEDYDKRKEFWVNRFAEEFEHNIVCLTVVSDFIDEFQIKCKINDEKLIAQEFWSIYKKFKPKCEDLIDLIQKEENLITQIEIDIENFKGNDCWEFDFDEYREYVDFSKPIELLFDFCDLLVSLFRLVKFQTLLEKPLVFNELTAVINTAFLRLEGFLNGSIKEYHSFGFNETFTKLFIEAKKTENYTFENCKLITDYWNLTAQLCLDFDKAEFLNQNALENNDCYNDLNEIGKLNWDRIEDFTCFTTPDEIEEHEHKFTISDVIKNKTNKSQSQISQVEPFKADIYSIKHQFDIVISSLELFYPLINTMWIKCIENEGYEMFKDSVKSFNEGFKFHTIGGASLNKMVTDAKLYLDNETLHKFYQFGKSEIAIRKSHLKDIISTFNAVSEKDSFLLEQLFFENCNVFLFGFPQVSIAKNKYFPADLIKGIELYFENFEKEFDSVAFSFNPVSHHHFDSKNNNTIKTLVKPIFKPESIETIYQFLKDFFAVEHQADFKNLLETGTDCNEKMVFLDNGNRLADSFKLLIKNDIITGCNQKELENWVSNNFSYKYRGKVKDYSLRYLNDIISTDKDKCQKPILNIKSGIVIKA